MTKSLVVKGRNVCNFIVSPVNLQMDEYLWSFLVSWIHELNRWLSSFLFHQRPWWQHPPWGPGFESLSSPGNPVASALCSAFSCLIHPLLLNLLQVDSLITEPVTYFSYLQLSHSHLCAVHFSICFQPQFTVLSSWNQSHKDCQDGVLKKSGWE